MATQTRLIPQTFHLDARSRDAGRRGLVKAVPPWPRPRPRPRPIAPPASATTTPPRPDPATRAHGTDLTDGQDHPIGCSHDRRRDHRCRPDARGPPWRWPVHHAPGRTARHRPEGADRPHRHRPGRGRPGRRRLRLPGRRAGLQHRPHRLAGRRAAPVRSPPPPSTPSAGRRSRPPTWPPPSWPAARSTSPSPAASRS